MEPSDDLVQRISGVTGFPRKYFREFDQVLIPEGSFVKFRSRRSKLSARDRSYVLQMAQVGVTLYEHMAQEFKRFPDLLPSGLEEDPEEAALTIRKALGASPNAPMPGCCIWQSGPESPASRSLLWIFPISTVRASG